MAPFVFLHLPTCCSGHGPWGHVTHSLGAARPQALHAPQQGAAAPCLENVQTLSWAALGLGQGMLGWDAPE